MQIGRIESPPPLLNTYLLCKRYNALPYSGGVLDQPSKIMDGFFIIDNTISEFKKSQRGHR